MKINKVVVIGSGTMGSGIAAHLCNANIPVTLLDLTTEISQKSGSFGHNDMSYTSPLPYLTSAPPNWAGIIGVYP